MKDKFFYLVFFGIVLALSRIIPHPPNFTPILAAAIMAPMLIKDRWYGMAIPVLAMFMSDVIIGFHPYQFVVYFSLLVIGLVSPMRKNFPMLAIIAVGSSVWFFMTTNLAVWFVWDYYPKTIEGLIACYTLALPFFKNTLISTLLFTFLIAISAKYIEFVNKKINHFILIFINNTWNINK